MRKNISNKFIGAVALLIILTMVPAPVALAKSYTSVVHGRDDGIWLFPVAQSAYTLTDWAGCSNGKYGASNPCIFDGLNHYHFGDDFHRGQSVLGHNGIDIGVANKSNVFAAAAGTVKAVVTGSNVGRGNYLIIEHPLDDTRSYYSAYQHLSTVSKKVGDTVNAGDVIALSGDSGSLGQYHLHFGILLGPKNYKHNINTMEAAGWFLHPGDVSYTDRNTKSNYSYGRILNNPSVETYSAYPVKISYPGSLEAHCGSVTYTFDKTKVSVGQKATSAILPVVEHGSVFVCDRNVFAIKADNSLWGWGFNGGPGRVIPGEIIPDSQQEYYLEPVKVADNVLAVANNMSATFILKMNGELWGLGDNRYSGALGLGEAVEIVHKPVKIMEGVLDIKTDDSSSHVVVLRKDGTAWHWRKKWSEEDYWDPYIPSLLLENVAVLRGSEYAIKKDGTMWELVPDTLYPLRTWSPQPVELTADAKGAAKLYSDALIKKDGSLWLWGNNRYGQIAQEGAGSFFSELVPMASANKKLDNVAMFSTHINVLAIKQDGSLWAWGSNRYGALGKGDTLGEFYSTDSWGAAEDDFKGEPYYTTPVKIMDGVAHCVAGGWTGFAVKKDGSLWAWGGAYNGLLGNGSLRNGLPGDEKGEAFYSTPVKIMDGLRLIIPSMT